MQELTGKTIVVYDGVCGLCNRLVRFLLRFDGKDRFRYAALQSEFAAETLRKHGINPGETDSVTLVSNYGLESEEAYSKSEAILVAAGELGGIWRIGRLGALLPKRMRDRIYDGIARNRYRMFGRYESCPVPKPEVRKKFVG